MSRGNQMLDLFREPGLLGYAFFKLLPLVDGLIFFALCMLLLFRIRPTGSLKMLGRLLLITFVMLNLAMSPWVYDSKTWQPIGAIIVTVMTLSCFAYVWWLKRSQ